MYKLPCGRLIFFKVVMAITIFFALICTIVAGFFVVYIRVPVNGTSMLPTLNIYLEETGGNDIVYINRFNKGKVGDIVVLDLRDNANFGDYPIKRLVATEGDVVNIEFDNTAQQYNLVVNQNIIYSKAYKTFGYNTYTAFQQYVNLHKHDKTRIAQDEHGNIKGVNIKIGEIFVLGDNWDVSKDSSLVGPISKKAIVGRVDIVATPKQNEILSVLKGIF